MGFLRNRGLSDDQRARIPPGQHLVRNFPVLDVQGPPYRDIPDDWDFRVWGEVAVPARWTFPELQALPAVGEQVDIHCVTTWSKLGMRFDGVSLDTLLDVAGPRSNATHVVAFSHTGYTTNLPIADVVGGKALVAWEVDGKPLPIEHGGPARLLVPHLYFWKSAKWVAGLRLLDHDEPGFWEQRGYHNRGDPWLEQRYWGD